jgi:hypothetical protein
MFRTLVTFIALALLPATSLADEPAKIAEDAENVIEAEQGEKVISGMSIVGNDEAPKSLVIVPWKSSDLGDTLDVSRALDDGRQPVDRDVFMRELNYYEIRSGLRMAPGSESN